ncbi:amidohydrolase family protein [Rhizobium sp. G21]|uniref:amidohydrolase family protein n=1 Tax=Rhizobium sp. G21 TaxID=2758439 RepID=UPI0015FF6972|nr:amidohydrolase [Rhizobium sp. G21]MBB1250039.1 amidohydrolase [Rhizobium sp. G21]
MIIDTHLHIVDQQALTYPWLAEAGPLNRNALYEDYAREARRLGIEAVLHMEVDVAEEDIEKESDYVASMAARDGSLLVGAIAACRPESADFAAYFDRARQNPVIKGFRRVLHVMPDELSEGAVFRDNISRLKGTGLTFDLVVKPHQLKKAAALADLNPDVQFILDHCGVPDIKGGGYDLWRNEMTEVAKRPNITGKLSGIVAYTDTETWTLDDIRPYAEHTIGSFGFDRMVWGSDWPVCTLAGTLSTWVAATHALLEGVSAEDKAKLLSGNARRIWRLGA